MWQETVISAFEAFGFVFTDASSGKYTLLFFAERKLMINLISLDDEYQADALMALQEAYLHENIQLIQLWEDIWTTRRSQIIGRVHSLLGLNKRLHGRKTNITEISQVEADIFLEANHIQASARAKHRFALKADGIIVAVACFSGLRLMKNNRSAGYRSAEVIRFASLSGYTVTGGFSKLLKHFIAHSAPNDVMSYADRDWSNGRVYERAGFKLVSATPPTAIYLDRHNMIRYFPHRLPEQENKMGSKVTDSDYIKVFNTGNLKYILYL